MNRSKAMNRSQGNSGKKYMDNDKAIRSYLIGAFVQIGLVCAILIVLRITNINIGDFTWIGIAVGGISTALWGIIISKKTGRVTKLRQILFDFFKVSGNAASLKQGLMHYGFPIVCLLILFGPQIVTGSLQPDIHWYSFFLFFLQAIVFGGIEEIGWRYTFQPLVETKVPYEVACFITFDCWAVWHFMYFYIADTLHNIDVVPFLFGLVTSCFILGAIYKTTKCLWLCVLYHSLLNVFSQTMTGPKKTQTIITMVICIVLSIVWVYTYNLVVKNPKKLVE